MSAIRFNPLAFSEKLKDNGMDEKLACVIAQQQQDMYSMNCDHLVTKAHLSHELSVMKMEMQAFLVKALIASVSIIGVLQGIFHFMN